jgi:hypothetical protein
MRRSSLKLVAIVGFLTVFGDGPAAALAAPPAASVSAAPATAGARPVVLTVRLRYGMTCRYPGPGPFVVVFPAQVRLPETIARTAVLVDGRPAFTVRTSSDVVTVGLPPPPEVLCQSFAFGTLTLTFTRAANLGNPTRAGSYPLVVRKHRDRFHASLDVAPR